MSAEMQQLHSAGEKCAERVSKLSTERRRFSGGETASFKK
jgi:hypothetical protein